MSQLSDFYLKMILFLFHFCILLLMFGIHSSFFGAKSGFENVVLNLVEIKLLFLRKFHFLFSFLTAIEVNTSKFTSLFYI